MEKRLSFSLLLFVSLLFTFWGAIGCKKHSEIVFAADGLLVELEIQPTFGDINAMETVSYHIQNDGSAERRVQKTVLPNGTLTEDVKSITPENVEALQKLINDVRFMEIPEMINSPTNDGSFYSITVYAKERVYRVSGLNPIDKRFMRLADAIMALF